MTGFVNVTPNSEDALKLALAKHGPVSVAIDASQKSFSFYVNGVYYDEKCSKYLLSKKKNNKKIVVLSINACHKLRFPLKRLRFFLSWTKTNKLQIQSPPW
jgi:Papain family cysteine protease.